MSAKKLLLLLAIALVLGMGVMFSHPAYRYLPGAWWRGESFYDGRPTSYWRAVILTERQRTRGAAVPVKSDWDPVTWFPADSKGLTSGLFRGDTAGLDVLLELLADDNPTVHHEAASAILMIYLPPKRAVPALVGIMESPRHRWSAIMSLSRLGRNAEEALPALNALKDSSDLATRHASLGALSIIDPTQPMIFETIIAEICASHPENRQLLESLRSSVSRNAPWDARPFRPCSDDIEYMLRCAAETPNWYGPKEAYLEAVVILRSQLSK